MSLPRLLSTVWRLSLLLGAASAEVHGASLTAVTGTSGSGYSLRLWQTEDGLPQNTVTAIAQTRDGYLWIGTYGGLARFDGVRFQNFNSINTPGLLDGRIVSLHEDAAGVLWIGHDAGNLTRYQAGHFAPAAVASALARERIAAIESDAAGAVWVLRASGALESVATGATLTAGAHTTRPLVLSLVGSAGGDLYLGLDGEVSELSAGKLRRLDFGWARNSAFVMGLGAAQKDGVWVIRDWRVQKWDGPRLVEDRGPCPWGGDTSLSAVLEMSDGALAVGTFERGLYVVSRDGTMVHLDHGNGLPQNWVRSLCEDREGNLWMGLGSAGLAELVPTAFSVINAPDQWQGRTELTVAAAGDGALWIGTEGAGLYRYQRGNWMHFGREEGLEHPFVWSVAEDAKGQIWAGTWGGGIFRLEGERFAAVPEFDPAAGPVLALQFSAEDRSLWIGCGRGLLHWPDQASPVALRDLDGSAGNVTTVVRDRAGVVWFGVQDGGLGRLEGGQVRRFRKRDGLSSDSIQCLFADGDGVLWIGTSDGGLNRLKDGKFATIGVNQGLASNTICHIAEDSRGYVWLSTHHGILRLAKSELNQCADGRIPAVAGLVFDRNDGLPTIEFSGGLHAAGCATSDGRLWFTSSKGVAVVDPARVRLNAVPPPVVLEALRVDGRPVALAGGSPADLRLRPEHQRLEFQYTALSLTAPGKVVFQYRLEGVDDDWVDAGTKRTASYSHLPAGDYVFRVIARNNDGVWNIAGAALRFRVLPFLWQTWWFRGLSVLIVLGAVGWTVRRLAHRRLRHRLEALERSHAIERERTRIAQDIHDDTGASLTRIMMLSQCVNRDALQSPQAAEVLDRIYGTARDVTRALDEIVWAVDPRHDTLDSLVCYMGEFAQELLSASGIRCRLDLPVNLPAWPCTADTRHNLFLAFKEALNNAIRHAGATEVRVALALRPDAFVLTVTDNGRGLAAPADSGQARLVAGDGLGNMRSRLATIGGRCEIADLPDSGTQVSFIVFVGGNPVSPPAPASPSP